VRTATTYTGPGDVLHLIHVGYPKTGSSLLQRWFSEHPQIKYLPGAIGGLFSVFDLARECAAPDGNLRVRVTSYETLAIGYTRPGEAFTDYDLTGFISKDIAENTCRALAAMFPSAFVLLVTRGMREMLRSSYSQHVRIGGADDFDPEAAARQALRDYDYAESIESYRAAYGSRLILLPYELLRDDPRRFVAELEERLGLDPFPLPDARINPSLSPVELVWYPLISRAIRRLPLGGRLRRALIKRFVASIGTPPMRGLVRLLQRRWPATPLNADSVPNELVSEHFRGKADLLRDEPLYRPYGAEYFFSPADDGMPPGSNPDYARR
jgi:hypothetical protein